MKDKRDPRNHETSREELADFVGIFSIILPHPKAWLGRSQAISANVDIASPVDPGPIESRKRRWRGKAARGLCRPYAGQTSAQTRQVRADYLYTKACLKK
jgi:hypothetical protein